MSAAGWEDPVNQSTRPTHPDPATLRNFVLGRLSGATMDRVERHLRGCDSCVRAADAVPADHLVELIRRDPPQRATTARQDATPPRTGAKEDLS